MASTDIITSAKRDIFVGDIEENRPNSEAVNLKIAGNVQYLIERVVLQERFVFPMYFNSATNFDNGLGGIAYIATDCEIREYYMAIQYAGSAGESRFNAAVYDNTGAFVNNLFGATTSGLTLSGNGGSRIVVGRKNVTTTNDAFNVGTAGHTFQNGILNLTTLLAGYVVVPFIEGNATRARSLTFAMKLEEI